MRPHAPLARPQAPTRRWRRVTGRPAGFTLIEVLVALAIVAIALGAGARAAGSLGDSASRLAEVTAAHWCAENQLVAVRLTGQVPGTGEVDFSCQQLGREYRGRQTTVPSQNVNFRIVTAAVLNEQGHVLVQLHTVMSRF